MNNFLNTLLFDGIIEHYYKAVSLCFEKKNLKTVSGLHLVWWKIVFHGNNENRIHAILKIYVFIFLHSNYQQSRLQISTKLKIGAKSHFKYLKLLFVFSDTLRELEYAFHKKSHVTVFRSKPGWYRTILSRNK